jgi:hypothetical protein
MLKNVDDSSATNHLLQIINCETLLGDIAAQKGQVKRGLKQYRLAFETARAIFGIDVSMIVVGFTNVVWSKLSIYCRQKRHALHYRCLKSCKR